MSRRIQPTVQFVAHGREPDEEGATSMADLNVEMADLARALSAERDPVVIRQRIVDQAVDVVGPCDHAALTIVSGRTEVATPSASSPTARRGDELQYELRQGPCLDAVWTQSLVHCPDLEQEAARWPLWAPRVVEELGVRSMLCLRLFVSAESLGALNLYSETPGAFDEDSQADAVAVAAHAAVAIAAGHQVDGLHEGMVRRTVIGQATGILMERYKIDATAAFEVLRRISQGQNRKIHDLAVELVTEGRAEGL